MGFYYFKNTLTSLSTDWTVLIYRLKTFRGGGINYSDDRMIVFLMFLKILLFYRKIENQKVGCAPHVLVDHHHENHKDVTDPPDEDDDAEDDRDKDRDNRLQPPENLLLVIKEIRGNVMRHFQRRPDLITDVVHVSRYF